jgi:hypothetical protein
MEYFGCETPFGKFFRNNSQKKQTLAAWLACLNAFRGDALFELRITKIGRAVLKLFD